jgi:RimJ/RimL family protein N-acetyltransferase
MNLETGRVALRPASKDHFDYLYRWRNDPQYLESCSVRRYPVSREEFDEEMRGDFQRDRHLQFIIYNKAGDHPMGTIFSYNFNLVDGHVFLTTYLEEEFQNMGFGVDAFLTLCKFLFDSYPIRKIYVEVYEYNSNSLGSLSKFFSEEGRFKKHRYLKGEYWDLLRLTFWRDQLPLIDRLERRLTRQSRSV